MARTDRPVAVVSGASRGLGKGIAVALGSKGYLVYLVGRKPAHCGNEAPLPGSLEDTSATIAHAGGQGVPVHCDMADDADISRLFDTIMRESGGLDLLVNNAAFLHKDMNLPVPFWEKPAALANIIHVGLRCHYLAMHHAIPLMLGRVNPLIVNISFFGHAGMHDPAYYAAKAGLDAMAASAATELGSAGIACLSLWPGIVATERLNGLIEQMPELGEQLPPLESPALVGSVIAALHGDDGLAAFNGKTLIVAEVAEYYELAAGGISVPPSLRAQLGTPHPANDINISSQTGTSA